MYIGPDGPKNARIAIVGEKGAAEEIRQANLTGTARPFVGAAGVQLDWLLNKIGISRSAVWITNAVKNVNAIGNPTIAEIKSEQIALYKELLALPNLSCIVPMGVPALQALTNFQLDTIGQWRGSILPSFIGRKMVPTYHPAFYMRGEWRFRPVVKHDLARALEESYDPKITVPSRKCFIAQTRDDLLQVNEHFRNAAYISFDIELLRGRYIQCIAFSKDPGEAYCIPLTNGRRKSLFDPKDELLAWKVIQSILAQEGSCYVTQNGLFDCWHLWRHGITTPYMANGFDTMLAHRLRAPDLPHDLGFLVSIYTREPYYKDESGDWKLQVRAVSDEQFWAYNCKDAACTLEVAYALIADLDSVGMLDYFKNEVQAQWDCAAEMRQIGMRVDPNALHEAREIIQRDIEIDKQLIESKLGWLPNTKSYLDMGKFYDQLGIKLTSADLTKHKRPKTDVERLYNHAYNNPAHRDILYATAGLNAKRTLQSGFTRFPIDKWGFYHPSLDISKTKTGRMAGAGADEGGPQPQNIPKRIRSIYVSDNPETDELTNGDLAGAETWMQAFFAADPVLMAALTKGIKVHNVRGCMIYRNWIKEELPPPLMLSSIRKACDDCEKIGEKECNHSEYYMSKQSGHALAYREGARRFCHEQRKKGIFIPESFAKQVREIVITRALKGWHIDVRNRLQKSPWLVTPLGRKREFYGILDEQLLNAALSWLCQTTVGQITNRAMLKLRSEYLRLNLQARIWTNTHDSVTSSHAQSIRPIVRELYVAAFNQPITILGRTFVIPLEITHGPNWRDLK